MRYLALLSLFLTASLHAATYYVTQSGAGNHDGASAANAWSLSDFNGSSTPGSGDTVQFSGTLTSTLIPASNGAGNGASRLRLDLSNATLNAGIRVNSRAFLTIVGGTTTGTVDFAGGKSHDITIDHWTYTGPNNGTATWIYANYVYNLLVSNCTIDNVNGLIFGDSTSNHDITISGCYARSSTNTTEQTDIIKFGDCGNVVVEKCKLINRAPGDPSIRHNDVIQNYQKGGSGSGQPTNWIIRYKLD